MNVFIGFCKSQPVFVIAFIAAAATMLAVPPDAGYADYCNFSVLAELFALSEPVARFSFGVPAARAGRVVVVLR